VHVIACSSIIIGGFPKEKEAIVVEPVGQPCEAPWIITFCLSKASPDPYSIYRMDIESCFLISMHVMYCALCVGFLDYGVIGCMVVPFHMYPCI
jgi:hypothetical protein